MEKKCTFKRLLLDKVQASFDNKTEYIDKAQVEKLSENEIEYI